MPASSTRVASRFLDGHSKQALRVRVPKPTTPGEALANADFELSNLIGSLDWKVQQDLMAATRLGLNPDDLNSVMRLLGDIYNKMKKAQGQLKGLARDQGVRLAARTASPRLDRDRLEHLFNPGPNDWGMKQKPGAISISWVSEKKEDRLRAVGFDFPTRAEGRGKITYKGRVVGYASNFSGLVFDEPEALEPIWKHRRLFEDIGFWWTNEPMAYDAKGKQHW